MMTRTMLRTLFAAAACTAIAVGATAVSVRAQDAPKGDVARGKQIYMADGCFLCHGRVGQGGGYNAPVPPLAKTELPYEAVKMQLRTPSDDMPAYSSAVISDEQIADIYAYLQSLPGRRDPKSIAILNN
ncbi:MAG TPA: cytochrome c [Xanthobacteraceae bacterium]|nr:cytochrome c [Xanthobacteraceae bacterium]